jgi:hypothetical protein
MKKAIIKFLGPPGSWKWALRQLKKRRIIYRRSDTGSLKYRLSHDGQDRIQSAYIPNRKVSWENAYMFLDDFQRTDWSVWEGPTEYYVSRVPSMEYPRSIK